MLVHTHKIHGEVIRDNETYVVEDNTFLKNLTLSKTVLHSGMETKGHKHPGLEEVYIFTSGYGYMQLGEGKDEDVFSVHPGDIVLVEDGIFHKVMNPGINSGTKEDLVFLAVFQSYKRNNETK
jgi:oxalate decarboxylase/phosphoglucose isomerase-like protein (cupin superfamily)